MTEVLNAGRVLSDKEEIVINKELQAFITPISEESYNQLERNIKEEGCLEALVVWEQKKNKLTLIDGHNRFSICTRHDIPFRIRKMKFEDIDGVKNWMLDHQLGRRNLTPDQLSYFRGLKYERLKQKRGGYDKVLSKGHSGEKTTVKLSKIFDVSDRTILRDAEFAQGIELIAKANPRLKSNILAGATKVKKSDIRHLSKLPDTEIVNKIRSESDLHKKLKQIRDSKEKEKEDQRARSMMAEEARMNEALDAINEKEPMFATKEQRLQSIKARIMSNVNQAITDKNKDAMKRLKDQIKRLEDELFGKYA
jgi:hypothetical protein